MSTLQLMKLIFRENMIKLQVKMSFDNIFTFQMNMFTVKTNMNTFPNKKTP